MNDALTVKIITISRQLPEMECDSAVLPVSDNTKGEFSGFYGIRKGHARTVFSLRAGTVTLTSNGKEVFSAEISDGFATVENNELYITVDSITEK